MLESQKICHDDWFSRLVHDSLRKQTNTQVFRLITWLLGYLARIINGERYQTARLIVLVLALVLLTQLVARQPDSPKETLKNCPYFIFILLKRDDKFTRECATRVKFEFTENKRREILHIIVKYRRFAETVLIGLLN